MKNILYIALAAVALLASCDKDKDNYTIPVGESIEYIQIPAGIFNMGSTDGELDEKPTHQLRLRAFKMSKYEVTIAQYCKFLNDVKMPKPNGISVEYDVKNFGKKELFQVNQLSTPKWDDTKNKWVGDGNTPMIWVTWFGAKAFADWVGGSLPTEAQWEYACRATTTAPFNTGLTLPTDKANFNSTETKPVGSYPANLWGLHDMHGNVWEWCSDWYDDNYYAKSPKEDPPGPTSGTDRVIRGGGWKDRTPYCRSAARNLANPLYKDYDVGFRIVKFV